VAERGLRILILSLVVLVGTACGGGAAASGGSGSQSVTVEMNDANQFRSADLTVTKGATSPGSTPTSASRTRRSAWSAASRSPGRGLMQALLGHQHRVSRTLILV
jgi:hypothetical protein